MLFVQFVRCALNECACVAYCDLGKDLTIIALYSLNSGVAHQPACPVPAGRRRACGGHGEGHTRGGCYCLSLCSSGAAPATHRGQWRCFFQHSKCQDQTLLQAVSWSSCWRLLALGYCLLRIIHRSAYCMNASLLPLTLHAAVGTGRRAA